MILNFIFPCQVSLLTKLPTLFKIAIYIMQEACFAEHALKSIL